ncbi:adenylate cyclase [Legionella wadsworthii]|uniref:Adenylate cyclase n=1 Tax=Legionella wadsworthii TaxID=28088 RepID=A0A378LW52_9GAMM|nr:adenylate/guanylate cyclase domain-containing protein [Legionella wadsworthii]STY30233.1 adenylate cyclase [Legionella wadsworthii]
MQTPLEEEILKTERLRTTILFIVFTLLSLMWLIFILFYPEVFFQNDRLFALLLPAYLSSAALYFLLMRIVINKYIVHKKNLPIILRYFDAFIEINIPTLGIIIACNFQTPVYVLLMPPVLLYFIFIILSSLTLNEWICRFSGMVAALEYWGMSYYVLKYTNIHNIPYYLVAGFAFTSRGFIILISGFVTGFVTTQIKKQLFASFDAQKERDRIESIFGRHVSPEVAAKLLSKDGKSSEYIPVCIMFLDIRNFSHFSEQNDPSIVVNYLNQLFKHMVKIIQDNKGIINKFLGDGFMAVFGAPLSSGTDVANAVTAAMEIIKRTEEEIKKGNLPDLKLGIGLHFGYAVTGTIGTKKRQEYTIIGDVVNSAAHIEQLNKTYHSHVLISEDAMKEVPHIQGVFVGNAILKHRDNPIKLYRLA